MMDIASYTILDNSLLQWGMATLIFLGVVTGLRILQAVGLKNLKNLAARMRVAWLENVFGSLARTKLVILLLVGILAASFALTLPEKIDRLIHSVVIVALVIQAGLWAVSFLNAWIEHFRKVNITANPAAVSSIGIVSFVGKVIIWSALLLLALDNMGFDITALIAGLGIGGIAVALAVQNILGDLFASVTIALDKPFIVGDFLIMDDYMGVVEYVGLKTTRLRSLSGEQIILSNSELLSSRIRNYGRMYERRVVVTLGVTYQTPREKLKEIPVIIRTAIEKNEKTRFDRAHFFSYGDYSLNFEYVYYVLASDYTLYMDIQQNINFYIHEEFERSGIEFAYPTQTMIMERPKSVPGKTAA